MNDEIKTAAEAFEKLIKEQLERKKRIEGAVEKTDFSKKPKITIGLCDGDGIGPIIMEEARRVLKKLICEEISTGKIELKDIKGLTIERRMQTGKPIPDDTLREIKSCDVILKGPTTTPHGGTLESANVTMRRELDLYANVRPVCIPEKNISWTFFRENSEGEYVLGSKGIKVTDGMTVDFKITTEAGTKRIARAAFDYARKNGKKTVAVVTKANIMKQTDGMFSSVAHDVAKDYPEITVEDWYIDIMTANLINEDIRDKFQVFLLPNLYGDILTDEAAQIQGGVGTAGSANIGDRYAMFEAIHGSAPRMIEQGLGEYANPSSILKAAAMMLRHINFIDKAEKLNEAIDKCATSCPVTGDARGKTCKEFADELIKLL